MKNHLLSTLPPAEWEALRTDAEYVALPAGTTLSRPGERVASVYFPTSGLVSVMSSFATGQEMEVSPVGAEGLIGIGVTLNMQPSPYCYVVHIDSTGYRIQADAFERAFATMPGLRATTLAYIGRMLIYIVSTTVCNRFHSNHQRLARWLLVIMEKSGRRSLPLTHDFIAQMVGGPRHAVTEALHELRERGALEYTRGHIELVDWDLLVAAACECYEPAHP